jgi:hypothetical protein
VPNVYRNVEINGEVASLGRLIHEAVSVLARKKRYESDDAGYERCAPTGALAKQTSRTLQLASLYHLVTWLASALDKLLKVEKAA